MKYLASLLVPALALLSQGKEGPPRLKVIPDLGQLASGTPDDPPEANDPPRVVVGKERIRFFDGSDLKGAMIKLDEGKVLHWRNESSSEPIRFNFRGIESMVLDRKNVDEQAQSSKNLLRVHLLNGDQLRCNFRKLDRDALVVQTGFADGISNCRSHECAN